MEEKISVCNHESAQPLLSHSWEYIQWDENGPAPLKSILKTRPRTLTVPLPGRRNRSATITPSSYTSSKRGFMERSMSVRSSRGSMMSLSNIPIKQLWTTTKGLWKSAWKKTTSGLIQEFREWLLSRYFITWLIFRVILLLALVKGRFSI